MKRASYCTNTADLGESPRVRSWKQHTENREPVVEIDLGPIVLVLRDRGDIIKLRNAAQDAVVAWDLNT